MGSAFGKKNTSNILNRKIDSLSGGEFQLLNLLLTLSKPDTDIIILDEPFFKYINKYISNTS